jgi:hypothetical protein
LHMLGTNLAFWRGAGQSTKYSCIQIKGKTCQNPDVAADYCPMDEHELKFLQTN